jgi:hypothetical protein
MTTREPVGAERSMPGRDQGRCEDPGSSRLFPGADDGMIIRRGLQMVKSNDRRSSSLLWRLHLMKFTNDIISFTFSVVIYPECNYEPFTGWFYQIRIVKHAPLPRCSSVLITGGIVISGCASLLKSPEVSVTGASLSSASLSELSLDVSLLVDNPNAFGITLKTLSFDVYYQAGGEWVYLSHGESSGIRIEPGKNKQPYR